MNDILILGYYGFKNSGDDALLLSIIDKLRSKRKDIKLIVLSKNPTETEKIYKVKAVKRDAPLSVFPALIKSKMLLVGGGTLIQDSTSTKSLLYYLFIILFAELTGKKVMLYANGIGDLKDKNRKLARKILDRVDIITLRDEMSKKELSKLGVTGPDIYLTCDAAFGFDTTAIAPQKKAKNNLSQLKGKKYFCVSVRDHSGNTSDFLDSIIKTVDSAVEKYGYYPVFMPFQKEKDENITKTIQKKLKSSSYCFDTECDIGEIFALLSNAEFLIGMRLHSLIYSAISKIPFIGIIYDEKVKGFMDYFNQDRYFSVEAITSDKLLHEIESCIEKKEAIKKDITSKLEEMKALSEENVIRAFELLDKNKK